MNTETRWEGAVLEKLTSNGERIAVVENKLDNLTQYVKELKTDISTLKTDVKELKEDVKDIKLALGWLKWIGSAIVTIALALVANGISSIVF